VSARTVQTQGWPCPTADEIGRIERAAIERFGIPERVLMETAGRAVSESILERFPRVRRPVVLCGTGNNGGDGYVIARVLRERHAGIAPRVLTLGERSRHGQAAAANLDLLADLGIDVVALRDLKALEQVLPGADLVVDAVFGIGLSRRVDGLAADALAAVAASRLPVVAVDLPSGLSSDSGATLGPEPRADLIVTLGLPKLGLAVRPLTAEILVADIGLPEASGVDVAQYLATPGAIATRLPARSVTAHKGSFGHVLVIAGSPGKTGAAVLAAQGAQRAGAGLVTVAAGEALHAEFAAQLTEAMSLSVPAAADGTLAEMSLGLLRAEAARRDSVVVGPGIGTTPATRELLARLLGDLASPVVVDADGLNAFAGNPEGLRGPGARVLTPHPGEAARLLGISVSDLQDDRVAAARQIAERSGCVALLKGARSVIAAPDGQVWINPTGGPGLASGGSGDVLAGVIGALLAQGLPALDAAVVGAYLHGRAGEECGAVGVLAGEVARRIPAVWSALAAWSDDHELGALRPFP